MEVFLKKLYKEFRLEGIKLVEQGLRKAEDYSFKNKNTLFYFKNFVNFSKKNILGNINVVLLKNLEREFNVESNINDNLNYYQNLYLENTKLIKELLKYKNHSILLNRELFLKKKIWKLRKKIILKIFKIKKNNDIFEIKDISILNKEKFYCFSKKFFYKSNYYLFLKKMSLKQIKERHLLSKNLRINEKKKYIKIEMKYHIEELRKNILSFIENDFEIKKANLEFLLDPYSYDLHYFFYEYFIKINSYD